MCTLMIRVNLPMLKVHAYESCMQVRTGTLSKMFVSPKFVILVLTICRRETFPGGIINTPAIMSAHICVGSFNILADGLGSGEFLCEGGDAGSTDWAVRKDKIVRILANMLQTCDAVVTQENDHFVQILSELREVYCLDVGGVFGTNVRKPSKANQLRLVKQRKTLNLPKANADASSSLYGECNRNFRLAPLDPSSPLSFRQESPSFGAEFAAMYGNEPDDLYQSDDGVGVYYRMDKLQLESVHIPGRIVQNTSTPNLTLVSNMDYVLACTFQLFNPTLTSTSVPHSSTFTLYGAHLSSGEDVTKEHARCRQLCAILNDAQHRINPVIAMDSNSSIHYESAYPDTLIDLADSNMSTKLLSTSSGTDEFSMSTSDSSTQNKCYIPGKLSTLIEQFNYIDAVGPAYQTGNECFKMRHGQGGQLSKHYQFMFDAIDKILVPKGTQLLPYQYDRSAFGFTRYNPILRESLVHLRTSFTARQELEFKCRNSPHVNSTTCTEIAFGKDHVLSGLYPNKQAPSDHPPVSCSFLLG